MEITFEEVVNRYELVSRVWRKPEKSWTFTKEESALIDRFEPIDIQGWLIDEVKNLRAKLAAAEKEVEKSHKDLDAMGLDVVRLRKAAQMVLDSEACWCPMKAFLSGGKLKEPCPICVFREVLQSSRQAEVKCSHREGSGWSTAEGSGFLCSMCGFRHETKRTKHQIPTEFEKVFQENITDLLATDSQQEPYTPAPTLTVNRAVTVIQWSMQAKGQNIHPAAKAAYEEAILAVQTHDSSSVVMGSDTQQEVDRDEAIYQHVSDPNGDGT